MDKKISQDGVSQQTPEEQWYNFYERFKRVKEIILSIAVSENDERRKILEQIKEKLDNIREGGFSSPDVPSQEFYNTLEEAERIVEKFIS